MQTRRFGKTGHDATIITMGGCGLGIDNVTLKEVEESFKLVRNAGINTIDIAPSYGVSEERLGPFLEPFRNDFFICEKTMERSKEGAEIELKRTLKLLRTDHVELYQFHAVDNVKELDQIFGKSGAMEAFLEAKETGTIKYIGLTGHSDMDVHKKALEMYDFDTLLLPITATSDLEPDSVNDYQQILDLAQKRDIGIISIKSILHRRWENELEQNYAMWYKPFDDPEMIEKLVHFTLSQEGTTTYSLPCDIRLWKPVIEAGKSYKGLSTDEQQAIMEELRSFKGKPLFPSI